MDRIQLYTIICSFFFNLQHMPKPDAQVPEELPPAVVHSEEVRQVPKIPDDWVVQTYKFC